jgi:glucosamine--fructose-6-phosphate aminotransferase (isomerizing)
VDHNFVPITLKEMRRQPSTWAQALKTVAELKHQLLSILDGDRTSLYVFTGCGTSYYLAIAAAAFFQETTGRPARAVPASELILSHRSHLPAGQNCVLLAFSRSGETTETVVAVRQHRERQFGPTIGFTCRATSTLGDAVDLNVALPAADDHSVVMTSSFTTMLLASELVAAHLADDRPLLASLHRLPELLSSQFDRQERVGKQLGEDLDLSRFVFLGIGPFFGIASEGMLKLKEMTQVPCETYSPLEFRHGPISIIEPGAAVILIGSSRARPQELAVLRTVADLGGYTVLLSDSGSADKANLVYAVGADLPEALCALLYTPVVQFMAYYRAVITGHDPDQPQHLTQVVTLAEANLLNG